MNTWWQRLPLAYQQHWATALATWPQHHEARAECDGDVPYGCWLMITDVFLFRQHGRFRADLTGMPWRTWYDEGLMPRDAAKRAIELEVPF